MKKALITLSTGILFVVGGFISPIGETKAMAQETITQPVVTIKSTVNVRTGPSTNYRVIGKLYTGAKVNLVEQVNSYWLKVERSGRTGYISARFAEISNSSQPVNHQEPTNTNTDTTGSQKADQIITLGLNYLGTPYEFGAASGQTQSFDCSSFVQYIFGKNDISLPRSSRSQASVGQSITSVDKLEKGDLLFFKTGYRSDGKIDHVAVYMGEGKIIHALPREGVTTDSLSGFWLDKAVSAKRIIK